MTPDAPFALGLCSGVPTTRELDIMMALWSIGSGTVADVRAALIAREEFTPAYTTVQTQLRSLHRKGWVLVHATAGADYFETAVSLETARQAMLERIAWQLYDGDFEALRDDAMTLYRDKRKARRAEVSEESPSPASHAR
jgi:predicted transcriptional regulator